MRTRAAQRGWAGLIGLLIALAIVLVLGRTVLQQMGLASPPAATASTPLPRQAVSEPAGTQAASAQLRVTAPLERARGVEAIVQQQARDAAASVERSTQ
jgi:flagellin-like protein